MEAHGADAVFTVNERHRAFVRESVNRSGYVIPFYDIISDASISSGLLELMTGQSV